MTKKVKDLPTGKKATSVKGGKPVGEHDGK